MRRRVADLRQPARAAQIAMALWIAWAVIVWNLIFDRVIVLAGRAYISAARLAAAGTGPLVHMDAFMRPAARQGLWLASAVASGIVLVGILLIRAARRMDAA